VIHNPHYFEFLRRQANGGPIPRQPGDVPCGGGGGGAHLPSAWALTRHLREQRKLNGDDPVMVSLTMSLQRLTHIAHMELPGLRHRNHRIEDNADLRLRYLVNELSEATWQQQLQRREKKRAKDVAVRDVYQMAIDTASDAFRGLLQGDATPGETIEILDALREYTNDHLGRISTQYHQVVHKW